MLVIETRLYPPRGESDLVTRPVSSKVVELAQSRRLTLITAPAGYGKTTLMVYCYQYLVHRQNLVVWLSLNGFDGSIGEFVSYLAQALKTREIATLESLAELMTGTLEFQIRRTCSWLDRLFGDIEGPLCIFIDDAYAIRDSAAETLLAELIKESPDKVHWVIGSRSAPRMALARMRARGQLGEIGVEDLRFSPQESHELLSLKVSGSVSDTLAQFGHDRAEGWPAGLQLIAIALERSDGDERSFITRRRSKERNVAAFFREEVFARLDEEVQTFLLHTCVLSRFTPALCDAITGRHDGRSMIEKLEESGLFIFSLDQDNNWYRYHDLFAEFLLDIVRDREPGMESALHLCASNWFKSQNLLGEAIEHAVKSNNQLYAAQLLDETAQNLMRQGEFVRAGHLIASLAQDTLIHFPRIGLWYAIYMIVECRFAEVRRLLSGLERHIEVLGNHPDTDSQQLSEMRSMLLSGRMLLAQFCDDIDEMERQCHALQVRGQEVDLYLQGTLQMSQLIARRERYRLRECDELATSSRELLASSGCRGMLVWHACNVGPLLVQRGESDAAVEQYRKAIEIARQSQPGDESAVLSMPLAMLADVLLERNEREEAKALFESAAECANGIGMLEYWLARYVSRARLAFHEGDITGAARLLNEGQALAVTRSFERLHWHVVHERIRQALAQADVWNAQRIGRDAGLSERDLDLRPSDTVTSIQEVKALAWARLAIAAGRHADALHLVRAWMSFAEPRGALTTMVRMSLLAVRALHAAGNGRSALRMMKQTINYAAPSGMLFCFLQEKEPIHSLLLQSLESEEPHLLLTPFRQRLVAALEIRKSVLDEPSQATVCETVSEAAAPVTALTQREIDILRQVSRSLLYKEIAYLLGLSEGSVKWYMQQIYSKLGVRRRLRAVEKARSLGYL